MPLHKTGKVLRERRLHRYERAAADAALYDAYSDNVPCYPNVHSDRRQINGIPSSSMMRSAFRMLGIADG